MLHKREIARLQNAAQIQVLTIVPTRLYFVKGRVKCGLAVAKGTQKWDKRATERLRDAEREARAAVKAVRENRLNFRAGQTIAWIASPRRRSSHLCHSMTLVSPTTSG